MTHPLVPPPFPPPPRPRLVRRPSSWPPTAVKSPSASSAPPPNWASAPSRSTPQEDRFSHPPLQGGRGLPARPRKGPGRRLSRHRRHRDAGEGEGRRRHPPRLRIPLRKRRLRPRLCAATGIIFIGPGAELLETMGDKTAARALAQQARVSPPCRAPRSRSPSREEALAVADEDRLPAHHQGGLRRRRPRHAGGARSRRSSTRCSTKRRPRPIAPSAIGAVFLEKLHRHGQAHRSADPRRQARQRPPPARARLLGAAPPPESRSRVRPATVQLDRGHRRNSATPPSSIAQGGRLQQRRHRRVSRRHRPAASGSSSR